MDLVRGADLVRGEGPVQHPEVVVDIGHAGGEDPHGAADGEASHRLLVDELGGCRTRERDEKEPEGGDTETDVA